MYQWLLTGHLIGVILWLGTLFAVYWLLRIHAQAPKDVLSCRAEMIGPEVNA